MFNSPRNEQYAMQVWAKKDSVEEDEVSFEFQDYRNAVKAELKRNPEMFEKVADNAVFAEWKLTREELYRRKRALDKWAAVGFLVHRTYQQQGDDGTFPSLPRFLRKLLEGKKDGLSIRSIEHAVWSDWRRNPQVTDGYFDCAQLVQMTLTTNPAFHDHDRDPTLWENTPPPTTATVGRTMLQRSMTSSSNLLAHAGLSASGSSVLASPSSALPVGGPEEDTSFKRPERSRRRERSPSPETYQQFARDPSLGHGGAPGSSRLGLSSQRGKRNKKDADSGAVDPAQWIQCDRCKKWVSTLDDNITDLSLYDDSNPNHLEYFCPACRVEEERLEKRNKSSKGKNKDGKSSGVVTSSSSAGAAAAAAEEAHRKEIAVFLDEMEVELLEHYKQAKGYWQNQPAELLKGIMAECLELEEQWKDSVTRYKRKLATQEEDLESARDLFEEFFEERINRLNETVNLRVQESKEAAAVAAAAITPPPSN